MHAEGNRSRQALDFHSWSREIVMDASHVDPKAGLLIVQGEVSVPVVSASAGDWWSLSASAQCALYFQEVVSKAALNLCDAQSDLTPGDRSANQRGVA